MIRSSRPPLATPQVFARLLAFYIALSFLQRLVYTIWIVAKGNTFEGSWLSPIFKGLTFDLAAGFYLLAPLGLFILLVPRRFCTKRAVRGVAVFLAAFPLLLSCCAALGEIFFFDEFHARYNFIAVDYLIYTTEVVRNILESYSTPLLALGVLAPTVLLAWQVNRVFQRWQPTPLSLAVKIRSGLLVLLLASCAIFTAEDTLLANESYWPRELSKNSIFALFSAYHRNSINYLEFYASLKSIDAFRIAGDWLRPQATPMPNSQSPLKREIHGRGPEKDWNVVMVVMESMSAGFLRHFGNPHPLTPNLDRLADEGLFFSHLFATGTRTVRGLEALMLSLPPTPGQSILRRPNSEGLQNIGTIFQEHGYKTQFVYGGYAYFDNMKGWFEGNGFQVVDHARFPESEIHFSNAWGVCDEDLFDQVLKQEDAIHESNKPFFQVVLTTSNHRPYTFPLGRIDMVPNDDRDAAVKYSDFAIGRFLKMAEAKPWYKNTLFIFVADHDAGVAGGTDIPIQDFRIPAIFYNPYLIPKFNNQKLASQIDLAPTLLGLLNFNYHSQFFGQDLTVEPGGRALLGTYQKVSLLQDHSLVVLSPNRAIETQELNDNNGVVHSTTQTVTADTSLSESARLAIAIYQSASELFSKGQLKLHGAEQ